MPQAKLTKDSTAAATPASALDTATPLGVAKPATRLVAMLYDGMLILALLFFVQMLLIVLGTHWVGQVGSEMKQAAELPAWYRHLVLTPAFVMVLIGFYGVFWRRAGQTLGMQTWRLKTVNRDGSLLSWFQVIKRILAACVLPVVCGLLGYVLHNTRGAVLFSMFIGLLFNYWFAWVNKQGIALHDLLSDTVTLKMPKIAHDGLFAGFRSK